VIEYLLHAHTPREYFRSFQGGDSTFFEQAYPLSGFGSIDDAQTCEYPAPAKRRDNATLFSLMVANRIDFFIEHHKRKTLEFAIDRRPKKQGKVCVIPTEWKRIKLPADLEERTLVRVGAADVGKWEWFERKETQELLSCRRYISVAKLCVQEHLLYRNVGGEWYFKNYGADSCENLAY
jgi:hypothetical protein